MNICNCPHPPGGTVICKQNQAAICRIVEGEPPQYICLDLPSDTDPTSLLNWAISQITAAKRSSTKQITEEEVVMLRSGVYFGRTARVSFSLPDIIYDELANIEKEEEYAVVGNGLMAGNGLACPPFCPH